MIGSILQRATKNSIIWGSGFIAADVECAEIPKKVLAVRGPLTRRKLLQSGIECPEIYGDPALLLPEIYPGEKKKPIYKIGIIPHYLDKKDQELQKFTKHPDINIIDLQNINPMKVVDQMLNCERILSSSLLGVIVADAYKIPSIWVQFPFLWRAGISHFKIISFCEKNSSVLFIQGFKFNA